jgi:NADH-quinone oxidoreductase subunit K
MTVPEPIDPRSYLTVAAILFSIGVMGMLTRRSLLVIFLSIELLLNSAALALITFARIWASPDGHVLFFLVVSLAAAESAVGLSFVIAIFRHKQAIETRDLSDLAG